MDDPFEALKQVQPQVAGDPFEALKRGEKQITSDYVDEQFRKERSWTEVEPELTSAGVDPEPFRQDYQLREARKMQSGEGIGVAESLTRSSIPFASALYRGRENDKYAKALSRFEQGKATGEDALTIARYERVQQLDAERGRTFGGKMVDLLGAMPAVIGEAYAGGKLLGAIGKGLGIGEAASTAGKLGQFAGRQAAITPLMPSLYFDQAQRRNIEQGRNPMDVRGFPTPLGLAYAQNLVLGSITRTGPVTAATGKVPTLVGRSLARGAVGTAEMAGVDVAGGVADQFLTDAYKTNTRFGVIGQLARGELGEGLQDAAVSTLGFALFAALHDRGPTYRNQSQKPGLVWAPFSRPEGTALPEGPPSRPGDGWRSKAADSPVVESFVDAIDWMKRRGYSADQASAAFKDIHTRVSDFLGANPDAKPADVKKLFERDPVGPLRTFAERLADAIPENTQAKIVPRPELPASPNAAPPVDPNSRLGKAQTRMKAAEEALQNVEPVKGAKSAADRSLRLRKMERASNEYDAALKELQAARAEEQAKMDTVSNRPEAKPKQQVPPPGTPPEAVEKPPVSAEPEPATSDISAQRPPESPQSEAPAEAAQPPAGPKSGLGGFTATLVERFKNRGRIPQKAPEPPPAAPAPAPAPPPEPPAPGGLAAQLAELQAQRRGRQASPALRALTMLGEQAALRRAGKSANDAGDVAPRTRLDAEMAKPMIERVWDNRVPGIRTVVGEAVDNPTPENMNLARAAVESFKRIAQARGMNVQGAIDQHLPRWAAMEAEQQVKDAVRRAPTREQRQEEELNARGAEFREQLRAQEDVNNEIARQLSEGRRQGRPAEEVRREVESVVRQANEAASRAGAGDPQHGQPAAAIGHETTIAVPGGKPLPARYELRELDSVTASHKADPPHNLLDRVKSGDYPQGLQPRDYSVAGEVNKVWDGARTMEPRYFVSDHPDATNGPPSIDAEGLVINGNGRQMMLEASTHVGTYDKYRAELKKKAGLFGYDPAEVDRMKRPALYRVVRFPAASPEGIAFARAGNVSSTQGQSPVRAAAAMSDMLTTEMIRSMDLRGDETFSKAVNGQSGFDFRMKLYGRLPSTMRDALFQQDATKTLTAAGQEFVQNMMLSKFLPADMIETLEKEHKRLFQSIEGVIPALMKVAADPQLDAVNLAPQLEEALGFLMRNDRVQTAADASNRLDQLDLFSGKVAESLTPGGRMMLDFLLDKGESSKVFRQAITKIIAGERGAAGLFDNPNAPFDIVQNAARVMGVKERPGAKFGGPRGRKGAISLPTWDDVKNSNLAKGIQTAVDEWTKLRGSMFPEMNRLNPLVADKAATLAAAVPFAEAATHYVMKAVFGPIPRADRAKFYAAHVESRLNYMASRGLNPISIIGPDSPLKSQAEYTAVLRSPGFRDYLKRWQQVVVPIMNKNFWDSQGIPHGTPIANSTQIPGYPISLVRIRQDGSTTSVGRGGTRVRPERVTQRRLGFNKAASGESPFGYELDPEKALLSVFEQGMQAAARANLDRTIVSTGVGKWAQPGQPAPVTARGTPMKAVRHVDAQQGTQAVPNAKTLFVDPTILESYHNVIGVGNQFRIPVGTAMLSAMTRVALVSTVEAAYHSANLMMQLTKPRMIRSVAAELLEAGKSMLSGKMPELSEGQLKRLMGLAEAGSTKAAGFQTGFLVPDSVAKKYPMLRMMDPTRWGASFLDAVDSVIRLGSDRAFRSLAKDGIVADTAQNKRDFLNSVGNYIKDSQAFIVRALRGSGIGPFATASTNTPIHSIRSLWASAGLTATSPAQQLRLRAHVLAKMAAGVGTAMLINYLAHGDPRGDETIPWGALKVGERNGRSYYVDPLRFMGPRRGLHVTGLSAVLEGKKLGASDAAIIHRARTDVQHALLHPAMGPGTATLNTLATGQNAIGANVAGTPPEGGTQEWENIKAALKNMNPSLAQLVGADRVKPGEAMPLLPLTGKGEGIIGDFPEDSDAGENALKLFAPYLQSRKQLPEGQLRGFMEKEALPQIEVPLRRGGPNQKSVIRGRRR